MCMQALAVNSGKSLGGAYTGWALTRYFTVLTLAGFAAGDFLLRNASGGVQEVQCACRRNGLFTVFRYADKLRPLQIA